MWEPSWEDHANADALEERDKQLDNEGYKILTIKERLARSFAMLIFIAVFPFVFVGLGIYRGLTLLGSSRRGLWRSRGSVWGHLCGVVIVAMALLTLLRSADAFHGATTTLATNPTNRITQRRVPLPLRTTTTTLAARRGTIDVDPAEDRRARRYRAAFDGRERKNRTPFTLRKDAGPGLDIVRVIYRILNIFVFSLWAIPGFFDPIRETLGPGFLPAITALVLIGQGLDR